MVQTVWLIAEAGMDRILVQTTEPTEYQRVGRPSSRILRADIEIPDVIVVDGKVRVEATDATEGLGPIGFGEARPPADDLHRAMRHVATHERQFIHQGWIDDLKALLTEVREDERKRMCSKKG